MSISIEDNFEDVIGKAQRGLGLSDSQLAEKAGIAPEVLRRLKSGTFEEAAGRAVAAVLALNPAALAGLARKAWSARELSVAGLAMFNTPFNDMTVNAYLAWDAATGRGIAFDTGADASPMMDFARREGVVIERILLTHTHGDHVFDLDRLMEKTGARAFVSELEPCDGADTFPPGAVFETGALKAAARLTRGHSKGGTSYVLEGLDRPVAIVGDAIFAGSMGGGLVSYADALRTNRAEILTLPDDTVLCPGHGPLTTVADEKMHNPFLA